MIVCISISIDVEEDQSPFVLAMEVIDAMRRGTTDGTTRPQCYGALKDEDGNTIGVYSMESMESKE